MTHWDASVLNRITNEVHFGNRALRCFTDRPADLNAMLAAAVTRAPQSEAVISGNTRLTYAALEHTVACLAGGLQARGIVSGDRVAILLSNRHAFLSSLLACLRLGAIAVPINIREGKAELAYILNHCGARLVIHGPEAAAKLPPQAIAVAVDSPEFAALCTAPPVPPPASHGGGHRRDPLHLRHHRATQRRDADPSQYHPLFSSF